MRIANLKSLRFSKIAGCSLLLSSMVLTAALPSFQGIT